MIAPKTKKRRNLLLKILLLLALSVFFVFYMLKHDIMSLANLKRAFQEHKGIVVAICCVQFLNCVFMALRYASLLRVFHLKGKLLTNLEVTFVSNGIGQWLPGSMAMIEVFRVGMMLNAYKGDERQQHALLEAGSQSGSLRSRFAIVSLFDRIIGFWVMLFASFIVCFCLYFWLPGKEKGGIFLLGSGSFLICFVSLWLPWFSRSSLFRSLTCSGLTKSSVLGGSLNRLWRRILSFLESVLFGCRRWRQFFMPMLFSAVCLFLNAFGLFLASLATSFQPISFVAILAIVSLLSIASLVPMGIGGVGGMQLVAVLVLSAFQVSAHSASSAQLLQTTLNLLTLSVVGGAFAISHFFFRKPD